MYPTRDPDKVELSTVIEAQTAAFLQEGNEVTTLAYGESGLPPQENAPVSHYPQFYGLIEGRDYAFDLRD